MKIPIYSDGIQEVYMLSVPYLILRENIEWVEDAIRGAEAVNVRGDVFGKESASERICEVLDNHIFSLNHLLNDRINELRITT